MNKNSRSSSLEQSSLYLFLDSLRGRNGVDGSIAEAAKSLQDAMGPKPGESDYFLTVLVRTQGKREAALKDALLCLSAQTDKDFHVVILAHDATSDALDQLQTLVERQDSSFSDRIEIVVVEGGSRARPLNVGLNHIRGDYVAVFDDDDLLFANWVEEFRIGAQDSPGTVQRAVTAVQHVRPEVWASGKSGYRAVSWPEVPYPVTFEVPDHIDVNRSPFMSVAFPSFVFKKLGLRFDEELTVCEDWDVILQAVFLCGVHSVTTLTSVYHMWDGIETSYTKHSEDSWRASEAVVKDRISSAVNLLPSGSVAVLRERIQIYDALANHGLLFKNGSLRRPFVLMVRVLSPGVRLMVKARNLIRKR